MPFTAQEVLSTLLANLESDEPDDVLAVLQAHDGKPFTKRLLGKLPGGEARWRIRQTAWMTNLEDRDYLMSSGNKGISLLIAYALTSVRIDAAWVVEHNGAYFAARVARNDTRRAATDPAALARMANALNGFAAAKAVIDEARATLDALTEYGGPFSPDSSEWERLCGAREPRS